MPIHEYQCPDCGKRFEELTLRAGEAAPPPCPACGGTRTERLCSSFSSFLHGTRSGGGSSGSCGPRGGFS